MRTEQSFDPILQHFRSFQINTLDGVIFLSTLPFLRGLRAVWPQNGHKNDLWLLSPILGIITIGEGKDPISSKTDLGAGQDP